MKPDRSQAAIDIGVSLLLIAIAAAFIREGWDLPPGYFEPVGAGPIPIGVAVAVIGFALIVIGKAAWQLRTDTVPQEDPPPFELRRIDAAAVFALTMLYVAAMGMGWIGYAPATVIYLVVTIWLLAGWWPRVLPPAIIIGLVMGYGLQYLFTRVLVTDLP